MKASLRNISLVLIGILAISACKKNIEQSYSFKVTNSNSQDITVTFNVDTNNITGFHADTTYSYVIPSGETRNIFLHLQPDDESEIKDIFPVPEPIYSDFEVIKSGNNATTDFLQQGEWTFQKENDYTGIYELVVDSLDF